MMAKTLNDDFPPLEVVSKEAVPAIQAGLAKLREPFPAHQISVFPKNAGQRAGLSYVGHAALTDRLLDADPAWSWEPLSVDDRGLPVLDDDGGMWIRLTVCGVTRLGYGDAQGKTGGNAMKERIGDALRNAAMRFGAALDLWHKGDLHIDAPEPVKECFKTEPRTAWDKADQETQEWLLSEAATVTAMTLKADIEGAYQHIESLNLDEEQKMAFWSRLDSTQRSGIKAYSTIIHAKDLNALEMAWKATPKHSQEALKAVTNKRKMELAEPEQAAA